MNKNLSPSTLPNNNLFKYFALLACFCLSSPKPAFCTEKPLWELGLGISALSFPDYRGSDESRLYTIPFPYLIYRGDHLKADRHGLRGIFLGTDIVNVNVSVSASLPVNSRDNRARQGMPDLQPTVKIGPALGIRLWVSRDHRIKVHLKLPVQAAFTIENNVRDIGWILSPRLNIDIAKLSGWNLGALTGPIFSTERYHDFFYSVAGEYVTGSRPFYDAKGGYSGVQFLIALSKRYRRYWVGSYC